MKQSTIELISSVAKKYDIDKVILFGSQAKGFDNDNSDYDLAVIGKKFSDFFLTLTYDEITLDSFDIHNYESISTSFRKEIDRTGVIVYEKV